MSYNHFCRRVLAISNECFSDGSSNGRTLKNLLGVIEQENLAQFFIHGNPDYSFCSHYYQVTDKAALKAAVTLGLKSKSEKNKFLSGTKEQANWNFQHVIDKGCRNRYLRDIIWGTYFWWNKEFTCFLDDFKPEIVVLQAGDMPIMYDIAIKIAKKYDSKLVMYNSEGYVLKSVLYNGASKKDIWHNLLQRRLINRYKYFMCNTDFCIYSTEYLENEYQKKYPHPNKSTTLYTVSSIEVLPDKNETNNFELLYCGNLGVGRAPVLDQIAKMLYKINQNAVLSIYGKFISEEDQTLVTSNPNVYYGGVVPYTKIPELMSKASMLLHCENSERVVNLKYAFSTKIADCLASGRPFLVYADNEFPFVEYLKNNRCCHIASCEKEASSVLSKCLVDKAYRDKFHEAAITTARKYHSKVHNDEKMLSIFCILCNMENG